MSAFISETPQSELEIWLKSLGFSRGNPFATVEADRERELLPDFFVDVDGYDFIKADQTVIVFAPRGTGKSALRVVLASQAAPISVRSSILAVEYTDFDDLITRYQHGQKPTIEQHVERLLRVGATALLDTFCGATTANRHAAISEVERHQRTLLAAGLSTSARLRLASLVRAYHPKLLGMANLLARLEERKPEFLPHPKEFRDAMNTRRLRDLVEQSVLHADAIAQLLADLNDLPDDVEDIAASPQEKIREYVHVVKATGFRNVHFLIDRVDEHQGTVNHPEVQADILEPLLAHLPILETTDAAFKFFLAQEVRDNLIKRETIRRDRLTDRAITVMWSLDRLRYMLNERLATYSETQISELTQICDESRINIGQNKGGLLFGEWLETELLQLAQGSPRHLLVACQLLCETHSRRCGPNGLLEKEDWEIARKALVIKSSPLLRVQDTKSVAIIGGREIKLTIQQHKILVALAKNGGQCSRDELVARIEWGTRDGVTDQAIDQAIGRLRDKLGDDADNPVYLVTERGEGFRLLHFELEE